MGFTWNKIALLCMICLVVSVQCRPAATSGSDTGGSEGGSGIASSIPKDSEVQKTQAMFLGFEKNIGKDEGYLQRSIDETRQQVAEKIKKMRENTGTGTCLLYTSPSPRDS